MRTRIVRELVVRYKRNPKKRLPEAPLTDARSVYHVFRDLGAFPREHLVVLLLDVQNRLLGYETVAIGTNRAALVSAQCVYQAALLANAPSVILIHNHPSDETQPSPQDRALTQQIKLAGELVGVKLLDHVIVTDSGYYSFAEHGILDAK